MNIQPTLPDGAESLSVEGYYLHVSEPTSAGWTLTLYVKSKNSDGFGYVAVCDIRKPNLSSWASTIEKEHRLVIHARDIEMSGRIGPKGAQALSEVFYHASKLLTAADGAIIGQIAEVERQREERAKRDAIARAEREEQNRIAREERIKRQEEERARVKEIYELVRWLEGQKFRLRRKGYRATVFGTINNVSESYMRTTSEKQVPMTIYLRDLEKLEIKYEDEKRYTLIYERKEETVDA